MRQPPDDSHQGRHRLEPRPVGLPVRHADHGSWHLTSTLFADHDPKPGPGGAP